MDLVYCRNQNIFGHSGLNGIDVGPKKKQWSLGISLGLLGKAR